MGEKEDEEEGGDKINKIGKKNVKEDEESLSTRMCNRATGKLEETEREEWDG